MSSSDTQDTSPQGQVESHPCCWLTIHADPDVARREYRQDLESRIRQLERAVKSLQHSHTRHRTVEPTHTGIPISLNSIHAKYQHSHQENQPSHESRGSNSHRENKIISAAKLRKRRARKPRGSGGDRTDAAPNPCLAPPSSSQKYPSTPPPCVKSDEIIGAVSNVKLNSNQFTSDETCSDDDDGQPNSDGPMPGSGMHGAAADQDVDGKYAAPSGIGESCAEGGGTGGGQDDGRCGPADIFLPQLWSLTKAEARGRVGMMVTKDRSASRAGSERPRQSRMQEAAYLPLQIKNKANNDNQGDDDADGENERTVKAGVNESGYKRRGTI
ncbi:hypothetical protein QBC47DRAFT_169389 [Echria macrotheca]|uniref:Uncharacterized protein n=1 Tax=Echria macrotheca TaxID=438768 RepID=A0AAJ0F6E8_9PEZI|nr:hypothetical protein QBC47DRAFT_169389 [Echria macrotheca]